MNNVGFRPGSETCISRGKPRYYEGETGRTAKIRRKEHLKDFEKQRSKSVLIKHKKLEHPNEDIKISMKITRPFKDSLSRQSELKIGN